MISQSPANPLLSLVRKDLEGRFNELDVLRRQWQRVRAVEQGLVVPPFEVLIHPSSACNLLCVWCIGDHVPIGAEERVLDASKQNPQRLPDTLKLPEKMIKLIDGIVNYRTTQIVDGSPVDFRVENVQFSGLIGEPLASRDAILAVLPILEREGIRTGLFTNGLLIDDRCVELFQRIDYVNISVDAGTSDTYNLLKSRRRGFNLLGQVFNNISRIVSAEDENSRLTVNASYVLFPENFHEVYLAAKELKLRGVRNLKVKRDISGRRLLNAQQAAQARELLDRIEDELVDESFKLFRIHRTEVSDDAERYFSRCRITDLMAAVGSDGNLYPCNYHPRPGGAAFGNATEMPFQEVWEGIRRRTTRESLPRICPAVCDPFKNRSNRLLEAVHRLTEQVDGPHLAVAVAEAIDFAGLK